MRLQCEFKKCVCRNHVGSGQRCDFCGHGECWHKREPQFESVRSTARKPSYSYSSVMNFQPLVPPLPVITDAEYCPMVIALPV